MGGFSLVEDRDFERLSMAWTTVARGVVEYDENRYATACVREWVSRRHSKGDTLDNVLITP